MEPASHVLVDDLQHEAAKDIHAERCQREAALCREAPMNPMNSTNGVRACGPRSAVPMLKALFAGVLFSMRSNSSQSIAFASIPL